MKLNKLTLWSFIATWPKELWSRFRQDLEVLREALSHLVIGVVCVAAFIPSALFQLLMDTVFHFRCYFAAQKLIKQGLLSEAMTVHEQADVLMEHYAFIKKRFC